MKKLFVFVVCFCITCANLFAQQEQEQEQEKEETGRKYKPREQNLLIDIPLAAAEITFFNLMGNMYWRLWGPDSHVAYFTADSIRANLRDPRKWYFEKGQGGDTFLVNQMFHPYAGGLYFAAARSNNFNFYWSTLFSAFGSISWEVLGETDSPASSDMINTAFGGIVLGEILHRLYIELDKGGIAGKIGATLLSPGDRITAALRGYGPEKGPSKISDASLALGFSWLNAKFFEHNNEVASWNTPAAIVGVDLVYNDPFTARSKIPFDHFEFHTSLTLTYINTRLYTVPLLYNFTLLADGYLASWILADNEEDQASNGLTLHFDNFVTDKGGVMDLNSGRENLSFNPMSLDYTIKWRRILNKSHELSLKTHVGLTPWAVADYNGGINRDDYNLYLFGGNIKFFLELKEITDKKNKQSLAFTLCFYDTWNIPSSPGFDVNTLFLFAKISWSFPLTDTISFNIADTFMLLHCDMTRDYGEEFPNITRWYNNVQLGIKISL